MEKWQNKIRLQRSFLRGWAKNLNSFYKKEKERLLLIIDDLDTRVKPIPLDTMERQNLRIANDELAKLRRDEESKWAQRAKVKHIQEGVITQNYFPLIANGKHRKKRIFQLEQDEGTIVGEDNLKVYITKFYKKLFGDQVPNNFSMNEAKIADIPQLTEQENNILVADFSEQEALDAINQMENNIALGPDGFPVEFYQKFWDILKGDIMAMFKAFQDGSLPLFHLNFGTIILLPEK
jgi:hypothetical protein